MEALKAASSHRTSILSRAAAQSLSFTSTETSTLLFPSLFRFYPGLCAAVFLFVECFDNGEKPGLHFQWKSVHSLRVHIETAKVNRVTVLIPGDEVLVRILVPRQPES